MGGDYTAENKFGDTRTLVVLSRFSGEGWDRSRWNTMENLTSNGRDLGAKLSAEVYLDGDFYLTAGEKTAGAGRRSI